MLKIALTGNIASGKSTVAELWRAQGATIIEADELARRAVEPGTEALDRIVDRWGPGILLKSGQLDRAALRDVVFRDSAERKRLEEIVHPSVEKLRQAALEDALRAGLSFVVSDIPLLFEAGLENNFDVVVLVDAPESIRLERLIEVRQLDPEEAGRMIASQWPSEGKRARADVIIENDGSLEELERRATEVLADLVVRAADGDRG